MGLKNVFVILSGGPCVFDPKDPEKHDISWDNFVTAPLLRSADSPIHDEKTEEVHWLVYEPGYSERWNNDISSQKTLPTQYKHAIEVVNKKKAQNYIDLIKTRAQSRGWTYEGISSAQGFWNHINNIKGAKVSRVWFYGHARYDLWLGLTHDPASHEAQSPAKEAILGYKEIKARLKPFSFVPQGKSPPSKFFGCNTYNFALEWAQSLGVIAEGAADKVNFATIYNTLGQVVLSPGARWFQCAKAGVPKRLFKEGEEIP